jgi:SsrA-binding protein
MRVSTTARIVTSSRVHAAAVARERAPRRIQIMGKRSDAEARDAGWKVIARNRKASHEFFLEETLECGIELRGTEVKSLRAGQASLDEAWANIDGGELWLQDLTVPIYAAASWTNHEPKRKRKLLAHRKEILKLAQRVDQKGKTLVPLKMYFDERGFVKVTLAVASGKQFHDKRESIKDRDAKREMLRAMRRE